MRHFKCNLKWKYARLIFFESSFSAGQKNEGFCVEQPRTPLPSSWDGAGRDIGWRQSLWDSGPQIISSDHMGQLYSMCSKAVHGARSLEEQDPYEPSN